MCVQVCAYICLPLVGRGGDGGEKGRIEKKRRKAEKHREEED